MKELIDYAKKREQPPGRMQKKLKDMALKGFENFEGTDYVIRPEGKGVYRIGLSDRFRLLGFYENDSRRSFIIILAYYKPGQQRGSRGDDFVNYVAQIKASNSWEKKAGGSGYPKIAN